MIADYSPLIYSKYLTLKSCDLDLGRFEVIAVQILVWYSWLIIRFFSDNMNLLHPAIPQFG